MEDVQARSIYRAKAIDTIAFMTKERVYFATSKLMGLARGKAKASNESLVTQVLATLQVGLSLYSQNHYPCSASQLLSRACSEGQILALQSITL